MNVRHLFLYCYFCPDCWHLAGGVQQVIGPLLDGLTKSGRWEITVAHAGLCYANGKHEILEGPFESTTDCEI